MAKEDDRRTGVRVGDPPMRGVNPELLRLREAIERLEGSLIDINNGLSKPEVTVERYAKRGIIIRTLLMIPTTLIMCGALLTTYGSAGFKWLALIFVGYIGCSLYSVMREHRLPIKPKEPLEKTAVIHSEVAYYASSMATWIFFLGWFFLEHALSRYEFLLRLISFLIMHTALTNWRRAWWARRTLKLDEQCRQVQAQLEEAREQESRLRGQEVLQQDNGDDAAAIPDKAKR